MQGRQRRWDGKMSVDRQGRMEEWRLLRAGEEWKEHTLSRMLQPSEQNNGISVIRRCCYTVQLILQCGDKGCVLNSA